MAKVLAVANQKGGVGKTTTCVNLAASLVLAKRRVLLIDMDPQGNASMGCGQTKHSIEHTLANVLLEEMALSDVILSETPFGIHLIPSNQSLTAAEVHLLKREHKERMLYFLLEEKQADYDYILLDCPPSLNMLTVNALVAADGVIIPMQCEYYALEGLSALVKTINTIRRTANPRLVIQGILRTMYDNRNKLAQDVSQQLIEHFGQKVFDTVIPRNVRLAEAPSHGMSVLQYDKNSRGAAAYMALAGELIKRNRVGINESALA